MMGLHRQVFTFFVAAYWAEGEKEEDEIGPCVRVAHSSADEVINGLVDRFAVVLHSVSCAYTRVSEREIMLAVTVVYEGSLDADAMRKTAQGFYDTGFLG